MLANNCRLNLEKVALYYKNLVPTVENDSALQIKKIK